MRCLAELLAKAHADSVVSCAADLSTNGLVSPSCSFIELAFVKGKTTDTNVVEMEPRVSPYSRELFVDSHAGTILLVGCT